MSEASSGSGHEIALRKRDAVRILFVINAAGTKPGKRAPPKAAKQLSAEMKLQALDFWVRNPDYLAYEMLELHAEGGAGSEKWPQEAKSVLKNGEPSIRRIAMLRHIFGAWEAVDDALATLGAFELVLTTKRFTSGDKTVETTYYITETGVAKAAELAEVDALKWYANRAALVAEVAGPRTGSQLKSRQHEIERYHEAKSKTLIPPVHDDVLRRLSELEAKA